MLTIIGGIAIEDAASLCALLPRGSRREDIADRLALYEKLRDHRAHKVQEFTRQAGMDLNDENRGDFNSETPIWIIHQDTNGLQSWSSWATILAMTSGTTRHGH